MEFPDVIVYEKERGYFIFVDTGLSNIPEDPDSLLTLADQEDCIWLILNSDGVIREDLPKWDW